jgi:hypothetical protein
MQYTDMSNAEMLLRGFTVGIWWVWAIVIPAFTLLYLSERKEANDKYR